MKKSLVIGAGPAGLMAAEMLADAGHGVVVAEAKPSVGRKFLMAGKSGLNLTKDEPDTQFQAAFGDSKGWLSPILETFGPSDVRKWAETLGQTTFVGSTGRIFPHSMKASPLLRAWLGRLADKGVTFRTRNRWVGWSGNRFTFETPEGLIDDTPDGTVLALGGASWAKLGADGQWATLLEQRGIPVNPFVPSNMGITLTWSDHMANHFGQPIKQVRMIVGNRSNIGPQPVGAKRWPKLLERLERDSSPTRLARFAELDCKLMTRIDLR